MRQNSPTIRIVGTIVVVSPEFAIDSTLGGGSRKQRCERGYDGGQSCRTIQISWYCLTEYNGWKFGYHCPDISEAQPSHKWPSLHQPFCFGWPGLQVNLLHPVWKAQETSCLWVSVAFCFLTTVLMSCFTQSKSTLNTMKGKKMQTLLLVSQRESHLIVSTTIDILNC